ncbi:hypothetical protein [Amycolatopsis sp. NPDC004625]|uniref:hypothetical protein n=1 Tax=Amycolatopsis sp. NPDC004625 TaxID=3154670 RepID=UPI0033BBC6FB
MTTELDKGPGAGPMLVCDLDETHTYTTWFLALRDMRTANGRNETTGAGEGNNSWIGLALGMIVLDILSTTNRDEKVGIRFRRLLTEHGVGEDDADFIYKFRCALHHAYGIPNPGTVGNRNLFVTPAVGAYAVDTRRSDRVLISVPVFCGRLVERIAYEAVPTWQGSALIDTYVQLD